MLFAFLSAADHHNKNLSGFMMKTRSDGNSMFYGIRLQMYRAQYNSILL